MYAKVGRIIAADGSVNPFRSDRDGNLVMTPVGGKYTDLVQAGRVFALSNQAGKDTTAALATGWTGLAIANPDASGKNLILLSFSAAQVAAGAAGAVGIMIATNSGLAAELTPVNQKIGHATSAVAIGDTAATIATPALHRVIGSLGSDATTDYALVPAVHADLEGSLIIPPGYAALSYTTGATTGALIFTFVWAEEDE